jgi:septal ring factor EnvC (AmiA/AmiB activator)
MACNKSVIHFLLTRLISAALLVSCFLAGLAQAATDRNVSEETLSALSQTIKTVQAEIATRNKERAAAYKTLQSAENSLAEVSREVSRINASIQDNHRKLSALESELGQLKVQKDRQQELITRYLQGAHRTGQQEYLKLLLNQENPAAVSRMLNYYRYFSMARQSKVEEYADTINAITRIQSQIETTNLDLAEQQADLDLRQKDLQAKTRERQAILDDLDKQLASSGQKLTALEAERAEVALLIEELRRSINNLALGDQQQSFASLKGKLPWPVDGRLLNRWGSSYANGDLNRQGVVLAAREGEDVRAIHHGRVVYSDWFSSSGLLLIIDHGDGYMSLYAHNQSLFRDVGEWVSQGEIIAAAGNTGGQETASLYFEIRHNGDAINPSVWCLARN